MKKTGSVQKSDPEPPSHGHDTTQCGPEKANRNKPLDIGASVRVSRLDSLKACRSELGKLYRESRKRAGRYPLPLDAKRLADVLGGVRQAIEMEEFERRLQEIEKQFQARRQTTQRFG